jgi:hypothetical protein
MSVFLLRADVLAKEQTFFARVIQVYNHQIGMQFMRSLSRLFTVCGADDLVYAIE